MVEHAALVIADDYEAILFRDLAELQGIRTSRFTSPMSFHEAANDLGQNDPPNLVIVDLQRRNEDAIDAPVRAKTDLADQVPFVALVDSKAAESEALSAGYAGCLHMPFTLADVCTVFRPYVAANGERCGLRHVAESVPMSGRNLRRR